LDGGDSLPLRIKEMPTIKKTIPKKISGKENGPAMFRTTKMRRIRIPNKKKNCPILCVRLMGFRSPHGISAAIAWGVMVFKRFSDFFKQHSPLLLVGKSNATHL